MPGQGRLGDKANVPLDVHGCPACPHPGTGPAIQGSPDVYVNRRPAVRVDDPGMHAACCGTNTWAAAKGSATVFINGKGAHRIGDPTRHCGGPGKLVEGSPNVIVGESSGGGTSPGAGARADSAMAGALSGNRSAGGRKSDRRTGDNDAGAGVTHSVPRGGAPEPQLARAAGSTTTAPPSGPEQYQLECTLLGARGKPRRGVRYELTLADGGLKVGSSGSDGVIRISGLTSLGTARLFLPDVDAHIPARWTSQQGTRYARHGVSIPVGVSQLALPPAVYRGRLTGMLFDSNKCFLLPGAMPGIKELKAFYDEHPDLEVVVSGHADSEGPASYNLQLSDERAMAIVAFLQDQSEQWLPWYGAGKPATKRWGVREDQHMLTALGYYTGPVHGRADAATTAAVRDFRTAGGLGDGRINDATRKLLIEKYMQTDGTTLPAGTKIQHHGCGEYHPAVDAPTGAAEAENRRVELFFFEGPIDPATPPSCAPGGCSQYPEWRKRTIETIDINVAHEIAFVLLDELGGPLRNGKVKIKYPDGRVRDAVTDDRGMFLARAKAGDSLELEIDDSHEAGHGDGIQTASGTHFHATGPI